MALEELRPRLWRWTARHPEWEKEPDAGWGPVVGCHGYVTPAGDELVLIDPLVPEEGRGGFWALLDDHVRDHGPPRIVLTVFWHERSAPEILERYGGAFWVDARRTDRLTIEPTHLFAPGDRLPGGLLAHDAVCRNESLLWLEEHGALFAGDILHGDGSGGVQLCPADWLHPHLSPGDVRDALRPLTNLPVELFLPAHGDPVVDDAREMLRRALAA